MLDYNIDDLHEYRNALFYMHASLNFSFWILFSFTHCSELLN